MLGQAVAGLPPLMSWAKGRVHILDFNGILRHLVHACKRAKVSICKLQVLQPSVMGGKLDSNRKVLVRCASSSLPWEWGSSPHFKREFLTYTTFLPYSARHKNPPFLSVI